MLGIYQLKTRIKDYKGSIKRLERHLEIHSQRLTYLENVSVGKAKINYSVRLARLLREVNIDLDLERHNLARLERLLAELAV